MGQVLESSPIIYNNYAYSFMANTNVVENSNDRDLIIDSKLLKYSLSNASMETVCNFSDLSPRIGEGYVFSGNMLYFIGHDENPHRDDYGNITWTDVGGLDYLCSINLDNGDYKNYGNIYNVEDEFPSADVSGSSKILGVYNNTIYIGYSFLKDYNNISDWTLLNFEFNLDKKKITESELPYASFINNSTYVYYDKENDSTIVLDNDETFTISNYQADIYAPTYGGKMFTRDGFYNLTTGQKHTFSDETEYSLIAYYDNTYILRYNGASFVKLTEEELLAL
ncbi:MAG: hypothetical protein LUG26_07985 [Ruminococcus sp.]|nr:hypothetical protein [Ruminococcus sp.]